jgi:hypothetical protein
MSRPQRHTLISRWRLCGDLPISHHDPVYGKKTASCRHFILRMLLRLLDGLGIAHGLARAAIRAVIADAERSVTFPLNRSHRARLCAIRNFFALFLIDVVHGSSLSHEF